VDLAETLAECLARPDNPERTLRELLTRTAKALEPARVILFTPDQESGSLRLEERAGPPDSAAEPTRPEGRTRLALRVLGEGGSVGPAGPEAEVSTHDPFTVALPLRGPDGFLGALIVERDRDMEPFGEVDTALIRIAAGAVTTGLSFRAVREDFEQRLFNLAIVQQIGKLLVSTRNGDELLENLVTYVGDLLSARACVLYASEEGENALRLRACFGDSPRGRNRLAVGQGTAGMAAERRLPLLIRDAPRHPEFDPSREPFPEAVNLMATPIIAQGEVRGVILVVDHRAGRSYRESDLAMLNLFAGQAAVALDNLSLYDRLERDATTDSLTGLANRRSFRHTLANEVDRAERYGHRLSLLLLDIDHFKTVNDSFGHAAGDQALRRVGKVILAQIRRIDFPARCGGEEFAVIMPHTEKGFASGVAERLRHAFEVARLLEHDRERRVTVSIGVASFPEDASDMDTLIEAADNALYRAKGAGRNRVVVT
jgi:diguanylate cyclase (GGDEF)-like protein